ncbi:hypothetical protein FRB95_013029 [Tulasnella sp. JGI-2019a]|nr:hypothetical protein FRB95_013029 [Tulasnella sp. JGI-2019a]
MYSDPIVESTSATRSVFLPTIVYQQLPTQSRLIFLSEPYPNDPVTTTDIKASISGKITPEAVDNARTHSENDAEITKAMNKLTEQLKLSAEQRAKVANVAAEVAGADEAVGASAARKEGTGDAVTASDKVAAPVAVGVSIAGNAAAHEPATVEAASVA